MNKCPSDSRRERTKGRFIAHRARISDYSQTDEFPPRKANFNWSNTMYEIGCMLEVVLARHFEVLFVKLGFSDAVQEKQFYNAKQSQK